MGETAGEEDMLKCLADGSDWVFSSAEEEPSVRKGGAYINPSASSLFVFQA